MREHFMRTDRILFSHWTPDDLPLARALWGDPAVTRYIAPGGRFDEEGIAARLAEEIGRQQAHGAQYWPLFAAEDGAFLGCCGLRPHDLAAREWELGFHLMPAAWGRGLAQEAARQAIAHAFDALGAAALIAGHHPQNAASARTLARLGFVRIGEAFYGPTGLYHAAYRMEG